MIKIIDTILALILIVCVIIIAVPVFMLYLFLSIVGGTIVGTMTVMFYCGKIFLVEFLVFLGAVILGIPFGMFTQFIDGIDDIPTDANIFYELLYPLYRSVLGIYHGPMGCYPIFKVKLCSKIHI